MSETTKTEEHPNPNLQDPDTGMVDGIPAGAAEEESKGLPDSGRHQSETAPLHPTKTPT